MYNIIKLQVGDGITKGILKFRNAFSITMLFIKPYYTIYQFPENKF